MGKMKYIMYEGPTGLPQIVLFDILVDHFDMVRDLRVTPVSAGFVGIDEDSVSCYGKSVTLGLEAREEDVTHFKRLIRTM